MFNCCSTCSTHSSCTHAVFIVEDNGNGQFGCVHFVGRRSAVSLVYFYFFQSLCESLLTHHPEPLESDHDVHMDICWQRLEGDNMCSEPLQGRRTTYTECCCLYGIAWSGQCAFCPRRDSGEKLDAHKTLSINFIWINKLFLITKIKLCAAVFRGLRNNVQPQTLRQSARAARIWVRCWGARGSCGAFCSSILWQLWQPCRILWRPRECSSL